MRVNIDLSRVRPKAMRINVTLPKPLARRIDLYAKSRHMSRSGFLVQAASAALSGEESSGKESAK